MVKVENWKYRETKEKNLGLFFTDLHCFEKGEFSCVSKHADVASVPKKRIKSDKANYRPFNILPNLYKIYRKLMYHQLYEHFNSILSS